MAKRKTGDYIFADAYIGNFSKNLMTKKDYMRIASCRKFETVEAILRDFGYGEVPELRDGEVEAFIRREQVKLYRLIFDTIPRREELSMYLYPFDYHNVKVCLKAELLGLTPDENYLVSTSDIDWMKIVAMVRDRNWNFMPGHLKDAIQESMDMFSKTKDPQDIDIILDRYCYMDMLERAAETGEPFITDIIKTKIDTININSFVRSRQVGKPWDFLKELLIDGGYISTDIFLESYEENYSRIGETLTPYGFGKVMSEGAKRLSETGDFMMFEKLLQDVLMEHNKKAKFQLFGLVPIAGYWFGKEVELDNLRIALSGVKFGFAPEEIEERLREPYV